MVDIVLAYWNHLQRPYHFTKAWFGLWCLTPLSTIFQLYRRGGARPPKIGKNKIFWSKIVIFSHEIPQQFSRFPLHLEKIWFFCVKSWFFTRNTPKIFAPPSVRRNFFKCVPPNLKSWIRPCTGQTEMLCSHLGNAYSILYARTLLKILEFWFILIYTNFVVSKE